MTLTRTSGTKARATKTSSSLFLRFTTVTNCGAPARGKYIRTAGDPIADFGLRNADLKQHGSHVPSNPQPEIRIPQSAFDDGVGLDLDEPVRFDEADDLHDGVRGPHVGEELPVDARHGLPVLDAREQDARAHDVTEPRAQAFEGARDDLEAAARLRPGVARRDRAPPGVERRGARDRDEVSRAHRARDADDRLVGRAAGGPLSWNVRHRFFLIPFSRASRYGKLTTAGTEDTEGAQRI